MTHLSGTHRSQLLPLPEAGDDYVGQDDPLRFIEAFVDEGSFEKNAKCKLGGKRKVAVVAGGTLGGSIEGGKIRPILHKILVQFHRLGYLVVLWAARTISTGMTMSGRLGSQIIRLLITTPLIRSW